MQKIGQCCPYGFNQLILEDLSSFEGLTVRRFQHIDDIFGLGRGLDTLGNFVF